MSDKIEFRLSRELYLSVESRLRLWQNENILKRLWQKDPTIWKSDPEQDVEISDRLGWLAIVDEMLPQLNELKEFAASVKNKFRHVVLLGMGGSSLAPELFSKVYGSSAGYPQLKILDSTHPGAVKSVLASIELSDTLFVVASKSGGTAETMSFYKTCWQQVSAFNEKAGSQFVALTDPGSSLEQLACEKDFLKIFSTPPEVGGRYSVLTYFGLLPAALIGMDLENFLRKAAFVRDECRPVNSVLTNLNLKIAALAGEAASAGVDKLTFLMSPEIAAFGDWVEQMIAESTGKEDWGILPVTGDETLSVDHFGSDRMYVILRLKNGNNSTLDQLVSGIENKNLNLVKINLEDIYDLGAEFYRWEIITALASAVAGINPFDQPDVQLAKSMAKESLAEYEKNGKLQQLKATVETESFDVFGNLESANPDNFLTGFLKNIKKGDYISLMAFTAPNAETDIALFKLKSSLTQKYKIAVTANYGPRFLHSTGQLHKGGKNNGYFIQFTEEIAEDMQVPGENYSFGVLVTAQAQGDFNALQNRGRRVVRVHCSSRVAEVIQQLASQL